MPIEEASAYCDHCRRPVLARREGINHTVYVLLTFFTCGLWGLVWVLQYMFGRGDYACPHCGGMARTT